VVICGPPVVALIDSGASHTVISDEVADLTTSLGLTKFDRRSAKLQLANGQTVDVLGVLFVVMTVGSVTWSGPVYVVKDLPYPVIIGINTLKDLKARIDFSVGTLNIHTNENDVAEIEIIPLHSFDEVSTSLSDDVSMLDPSQSHKLDEFLQRWRTQFDKSPGRTDLVKHQLYLEPGTVPVKQRYYPVSPAVQLLINEEIDRMLDKDFIEPSDSPWSSPILMVSKKHTDKKRLVVDFRRLNQVTRKNAFPIPYISSILDKLKDAKFLTSLDLESGYWQVSLEESSRPLTAFTVPGKGLFQFKVMPMGLHSAGATFQNLMEKVFRDLIGEKVFVYLDDILVVSKSWDEHVSLLDRVFTMLFQSGLKINWDKCRFARPYVNYLGYIAGQGHLQVDPDKVKSVAEFPVPSSQRNVRSFLGMCSWYRRFIPDFAGLTAPLNDLLKVRIKFEWKEDHQRAFDCLKQKLISAPILSCPDFSHPFTIECDSSDFGVGSVLLQHINNEERVIAYFSKTLNRAERNYSVTEKECLACLMSLEKFRPYVEGSHVTVVTDHSSLVWLHNIKNPTGRIARWLTRFGQFDFHVVHRKGKFMNVPDALSRNPVVAVVDVHDDIVLSDTNDQWYLDLRTNILDTPDNYPLFSVVDNLIYKYVTVGEEHRNLLIVPADKRQDILKLHHDSATAGHPGFSKTMSRIKRFYFWPKMFLDVKRYVASCQLCQRFKTEKRPPAGLMKPKSSMVRPWSIVTSDIIGPLPLSRRQNRYVLMFTDVATKWVVAVPLRKVTSTEVCKCLREKVIYQFGCPDVLLTDNGSQYTSKVFKDLCQVFQIKLNHTPFYTPFVNPTERHNATLETMIAIFTHDNHRDWDVHLASLVFAINTNVSQSTGFSPAVLNFGREFRGPDEPYNFLDRNVLQEEFQPTVHRDQLAQELADTLSAARAVMTKASERQARYYNLRRREVLFRKGDLVWKRDYTKSSGADRTISKFDPKYVGPCKVKAVRSDSQYVVETLGGKDLGLWHVKDLKAVVV
jgi:predicted aspartyl protease/transposase InsO family protein